MPSMDGVNRSVIAAYRANAGKVGGPLADSPLLLLTTTGAKSGRPHTTPLGFTTDDDRIIVIASNRGAPANPAWYHNLVAHPEATVELGRQRFKVHAVIPEGEERDRLFDRVAQAMPFFIEHQRKTSRRIPVVVLERQD